MRIDCSCIDPKVCNDFCQIVSQSHSFKSTLSFQTIKDGYIYPYKCNFWQIIGGVKRNDGTAVLESTVQLADYGFCGYDESKIDECIPPIIFVGCFHRCWGHLLTDNLKKLWFLKSEEGKHLLASGALVYYSILPGNPLAEYSWRVLELAGFSREIFHKVDNIIHCGKIIIPDETLRSKVDAYSDSFRWHPEQLKFIENIRSNEVSKTECYDKIYFSRAKWGGNFRDFGEKRLERVFKKLGYKILYPETLSVDDQVHLLSNCKYFATTEGSISHSSIFCQPDTKVTILRKSHLLNHYQAAINEMMDLDVTYIDAHRSNHLNRAVPYYGPFYMCINQNLERYVGHRILHLPFWLDPIWYLYINHHRLKNWRNIMIGFFK